MIPDRSRAVFVGSDTIPINLDVFCTATSNENPIPRITRNGVICSYGYMLRSYVYHDALRPIGNLGGSSGVGADQVVRRRDVRAGSKINTGPGIPRDQIV